MKRTTRLDTTEKEDSIHSATGIMLGKDKGKGRNGEAGIFIGCVYSSGKEVRKIGKEETWHSGKVFCSRSF